MYAQLQFVDFVESSGCRCFFDGFNDVEDELEYELDEFEDEFDGYNELD